MRGLLQWDELSIGFADRDPSSVADFVRATFSHKGRRKSIHDY
jgi:hypothetical protein